MAECQWCDLPLTPVRHGVVTCKHCDAICEYRFCRRCSGAAKRESGK